MNPYVRPSRRTTDKPMTKLERLERTWRDLVPVIAVAMAGYAVVGVEGKADRAQDTAIRQQEGRRVAVDVLCGGIVGVENAGRLTLLNQLPGVPAARMPSREVRLRETAARAYTILISEAVIEQAGVKDASSVLRPDGSIDCEGLKRAARATTGP